MMSGVNAGTPIGSIQAAGAIRRNLRVPLWREGYSDYFVNLKPVIRNESIKRLEHDSL